MIQKTRLQPLNRNPSPDRDFVLYWMQASQRVGFNHALEYAVRTANELRKPLVVLFVLSPGYPGANLRHYRFMLEGIREVKKSLEKRGILFVVRVGSPPEEAAKMARRACRLITDRGYTRVQKEWRTLAAAAVDCTMVQVESDVVVPVEIASSREEYAAATIRSKIMRSLRDYLVPVRKSRLKKDSLGLRFQTFDLDALDAALPKIGVDSSVGPVNFFTGGAARAEARLEHFLQHNLSRYAERSNDPNAEAISNLSPYLHFGQISPLEVALRVKSRMGAGEAAFLEQLIVRRELSVNFVHYNPRYDRWSCLPDWAAKSLLSHRDDRREFLYSLADLEQARTHDPYWNAAQKEMVLTGKMHGYMRMYWGKKVLEWSPTPETAFRRLLTLNDRYELDGRDPNGFTGVAWCFGKHDRPWGERPVFGKIRYMNDRGLRRKFDADGYVRKVEKLASASS